MRDDVEAVKIHGNEAAKGELYVEIIVLNMRRCRKH